MTQTPARLAAPVGCTSRPTGGGATEAKDQPLEMLPTFSCAFATEKLFYLREPSQIIRYLAGLRLAQVPEH